MCDENNTITDYESRESRVSEASVRIKKAKIDKALLDGSWR